MGFIPKKDSKYKIVLISICKMTRFVLSGLKCQIQCLKRDTKRLYISRPIGSSRGLDGLHVLAELRTA